MLDLIDLFNDTVSNFVIFLNDFQIAGGITVLHLIIIIFLFEVIMNFILK